MTQEKLAYKLGVSRQYLNGVLRGKIKPSIRLAKEINKLIGKPFFDLRPDLRKLMREYL